MAAGAWGWVGSGPRPVPGSGPGCWLAAACLALVLAGAAAPGRAQAPGPAAIPVEPAAPGEAPPAGTALHLRLWLQDAPALAALLGLKPTAATANPGSLTLQLAPGAPLEGVSADGALEPSFIVDFDDPAVARLSEQLRTEQAGRVVDAAAVEAFVARVMQGVLTANATLASQVARTLRGDCTEYALLLAALARRHGIPARMVHGAALLHADGRWQAYGHAWVQTLEAGRWTLRDSALAGTPGTVYHVPALVITDEGPGYKLAMVQGFQRMPGRIEVLGPVAAPEPLPAAAPRS